MSSVEYVNRLFDVSVDSPRVGILMSGGGSNARKILEHRDEYRNWDIVSVISDSGASNARRIAEDHGVQSHILEWDRTRFPKRVDYFAEMAKYLESERINLLLYAGFMRITPALIVDNYPGINFHPSDLTVRDASGHPRFTGMDALPDMIASGIGYVASTAYAVDTSVDGGTILLVTGHVPVTVDDVVRSREVHEELKVKQEHVWYPRVLRMLSEGQLTLHNIPVQAETLGSL